MEERTLFAEVEEVEQLVRQVIAKQKEQDAKLDQILAGLSPPKPAESLVLTLGAPVSQ